MNKYIAYLKYIIRHKWFVFIECCRMGIPLRGAIHDMSKFLPSEFFPYARHFYGKKVRDKTGYYKPTDTGDPAFDHAWFLHQKRNAHHWQYWIFPDDEAHGWLVQGPGDGYEPTSVVGENGKIRLTVLPSEQAAEWLSFPEAKQTRDCDYGFQGYVPEQSYKVSRYVSDLLNSRPKVLPMPKNVMKEMLADWRGAGRAQGTPNTKAWYEANCKKMLMHPDTKTWIVAALYGKEDA